MNGTEVQALMQVQASMGSWNRPSSDDHWAEVLATLSLFSGVSKRRLRKLARHATFTEFAPGETVVEWDEPAHSLYVILDGRAEVRGKRAARALGTGDYFGELGLIGSGRRSATVVATSELQVMSLSRQSFLWLAHHNPAISLAMLGNLGAQFRRLEAQPGV